MKQTPLDKGYGSSEEKKNKLFFGLLLILYLVLVLYQASSEVPHQPYSELQCCESIWLRVGLTYKHCKYLCFYIRTDETG